MRFKGFKVNTKLRIKDWRLWLAQKIAPAGADVHDPDESACLGLELLLSGIYFSQITVRDSRLYLDVTDDVDDLATWTVLTGGPNPGRDNLIDADLHGGLFLTPTGERELARMWGGDRMPPWAGWSVGHCDEHGAYDCFPGDRVGCPKCALERGARAPAWEPL